MAARAQSPHSAGWKILYRAALLETNDSEMAQSISFAEEAIVERMIELFREIGADVEGERETMDDATYALRTWKIALKNRTHAA